MKDYQTLPTNDLIEISAPQRSWRNPDFGTQYLGPSHPPRLDFGVAWTGALLMVLPEFLHR